MNTFSKLLTSKIRRCTARLAFEEFGEVGSFLKTQLFRDDPDGEVRMVLSFSLFHRKLTTLKYVNFSIFT
jgi:hypothetical protein